MKRLWPFLLLLAGYAHAQTCDSLATLKKADSWALMSTVTHDTTLVIEISDVSALIPINRIVRWSGTAWDSLEGQPYNFYEKNKCYYWRVAPPLKDWCQARIDGSADIRAKRGHQRRVYDAKAGTCKLEGSK
jgi:hypothetical protein